MLVAGLRLTLCIGLGNDAMIVMCEIVGVNAMMAMRMHVERSKHAHISAEAAGAQGDRNHHNSQNLACQHVHA
ncbi:MAG TPA: hypothetical protein VEA77_01290 [Hyphomicrobium sp.]|nr:hypothetical protein [Hyphomicrobium sp.]